MSKLVHNVRAGFHDPSTSCNILSEEAILSVGNGVDPFSSGESGALRLWPCWGACSTIPVLELMGRVRTLQELHSPMLWVLD